MRARTADRRGGRAVVGLLVGLLLGGGLVAGFHWYRARDAGTVRDPALDTADELNLVPADAMAFAHVRAADLWKSEAFAEFRKVVERAGSDSLKALDDGFSPAPSSIDRVTFVALKPDAVKGATRPADLGDGLGLLIVATSAPVDAANFRKGAMPAAVKKTANDKDYWLDPKGGDAVHFPTDRLIVYGKGPSVRAFLAKPAAADGALAGAIKLAAGGTRHFVAAVNMAYVPISAAKRKELPAEALPLLKAESVTFGLVAGKGGRFDVRAAYKDEADATAAEHAVKKAAEAGRKQLWELQTKVGYSVKGQIGQEKPRPLDELPAAAGGVFMLGALNTVEEWLADPQLKRDGPALTATVTIPPGEGSMIYLNTVAMIVSMPGGPINRPAEFKFVGEVIKPTRQPR